MTIDINYKPSIYDLEVYVCEEPYLEEFGCYETELDDLQYGEYYDTSDEERER